MPERIVKLGSMELTQPQVRFLLAFLLDRRKLLVSSIVRLEASRDYSRKLSSEEVCNRNILKHRCNLQWVHQLLVSLGAEPEELADRATIYGLDAGTSPSGRGDWLCDRGSGSAGQGGSGPVHS